MSLLQTFFKIEPGRIPAPPTGTPFEKQREITRAQIARTTAFRPIAEKFKARGHTSRAAAEAERDRILAAHPGIDLRIAEYSPINMDSLFNLIPAATAQRRNSKTRLEDRVSISNPISDSGRIDPGNHAKQPKLRKITIMASTKQTAAAFDVSTANGPALVAEFNRLAALLGVKSVNKFADRKTAQKRVADAAAKVAALAPAPKAKAVKADKPAKVAKAPKTPKAPADRSAAIAKSWLDPKVAAKRAERNGCRVAGVEYPSVPAAFRALSLPMGRCIAFRLSLKAAPNGKLAFEGHNFILTSAAE